MGVNRTARVLVTFDAGCRELCMASVATYGANRGRVCIHTSGCAQYPVDMKTGEVKDWRGYTGKVSAAGLVKLRLLNTMA